MGGQPSGTHILGGYFHSLQKYSSKWIWDIMSKLLHEGSRVRPIQEGIVWYLLFLPHRVLVSLQPGHWEVLIWGVLSGYGGLGQVPGRELCRSFVPCQKLVEEETCALVTALFNYSVPWNAGILWGKGTVLHIIWRVKVCLGLSYGRERHIWGTKGVCVSDPPLSEIIWYVGNLYVFHPNISTLISLCGRCQK